MIQYYYLKINQKEESMKKIIFVAIFIIIE